MSQFAPDLKSFVFTRENLRKVIKSLGWAGFAIAVWQGLVTACPALDAYGGQVAPLLAAGGIALNEWRRGDR